MPLSYMSIWVNIYRNYYCLAYESTKRRVSNKRRSRISAGRGAVKLINAWVLTRAITVILI